MCLYHVYVCAVALFNTSSANKNKKVGSHQSAAKFPRHKMLANNFIAKHAEQKQCVTKSWTVAKGLLFPCPIDSINSIDVNRL